MKYQKLIIIIVFILNSSHILAERRVSLNYDCSFEYPLSEIIPETLIDSESDGIFRVNLELRTYLKRRRPYSLTITKTWPILENNSSIFQAKLRSSNLKIRKRRKNRKRIFRLLLLKMAGPLSDSVEAKYKVFNRELYNGKSCQNCSRYLSGACSKVE